jgi:small GTP-binding protein
MVVNSVPVYKIVVVGDESVGKTSLIRRYCENKFSESRVETIGIDFQSKTITLEEEEQVCMVIWDVAGQERFSSFRDQYYMGALAVALVYDVAKPTSFDSLENWLCEANRSAPGVPIIVIANKTDLDEAVSYEQAKAWAADHDFPFFATSAKTGENVEEMFYRLGSMADKHLEDLESFGGF